MSDERRWDDHARPWPEVLDRGWRPERGLRALSKLRVRDFFARTHLHPGLVALLGGVLERLDRMGARGVFSLGEVPGSGRSHALAAVYHALRTKRPDEAHGLTEVLVAIGLSAPPDALVGLVDAREIPPQSCVAGEREALPRVLLVEHAEAWDDEGVAAVEAGLVGDGRSVLVLEGRSGEGGFPPEDEELLAVVRARTFGPRDLGASREAHRSAAEQVEGLPRSERRRFFAAWPLAPSVVDRACAFEEGLAGVIARVAAEVRDAAPGPLILGREPAPRRAATRATPAAPQEPAAPRSSPSSPEPTSAAPQEPAAPRSSPSSPEPTSAPSAPSAPEPAGSRSAVSRASRASSTRRRALRVSGRESVLAALRRMAAHRRPQPFQRVAALPSGPDVVPDEPVLTLVALLPFGALDLETAAGEILRSGPGDVERRFRNSLLFVTASRAAAEGLVEEIQHLVAAQRSLRKHRATLEPARYRELEAASKRTERELAARVRGCWEELLVPGERSGSWRRHALPAGELPARAWAAALGAGVLRERIGGQELVEALDRRGWSVRDHLRVFDAKLVLASALGTPRPTGPEVVEAALDAALREGLFALAEGFRHARNRYEGLRVPAPEELPLDDDALLVKRSVAARHGV